MGRRDIAIFLFISLAFSVIPTIQNNNTEPIFATAQLVNSELSTEQKRLINQAALRIINANPSLVRNGTIITQSPAAVMMVTALAQVIERIVVQTSNPDQIITHLAIETAANPTGPISQGLLLFAQRLAEGDTTGVSQLESLIAHLTESSTAANVTTQAEDITGNISQLIVQQAFQSALGANQLLNQVANKLGANSSKLSVNNVTISSDAIAQAIQQIIIQVSLQPQGVLSFQPLLFIANQVNENPLGALSKSIVQLAQLQTTGGVNASQLITQSISELVKQILSSAEGTITKSLGTTFPTKPTSEDESKDTRTKIIIRDKFDEREPTEFQPPPEQPPQQFQDNQSLIVPITNKSTSLPPPPTPMNATSPEDEILPQTPIPIDNNQTVQLRVIKEVVNDNGGTRAAEDLDINLVDSRGESVYPSSPIAPTENERVFDLAVGRYYLQAGDFEYLAIFEGDCDNKGKVTIVGDGTNKRCTVKFDDRIIGAVKFVTDVINDNGGNKTARDFQFDLIRAGGVLVTIRGAPPPDGETWTTPSDYSIVPHTVPDYNTTLEGDCTDVLVVDNLTKSCTIINDDLPVAGDELLVPPPSTPTGNKTAQLKVISQVINDNGGNKTATDFNIGLLNRTSGQQVKSPEPSTPAPNGITFSMPPGEYKIFVEERVYNQDTMLPLEYSATFEGGCNSEGLVKLREFGELECIVKHDDGAGEVIVSASLVNDEGGNASFGDFNFHVASPTGSRVASLQQGDNYFLLSPGTHTVKHELVIGYNTTFEGSCDSSGQVLISQGSIVQCTVQSNDGLNESSAILAINTNVLNNHGVTVRPQDLGATVDIFGSNGSIVVAQIPALDGTRNSFLVPPGTYTINFSPGPSIPNFLGNYSFASTCPGPQFLAAGDTKTCFVLFRDIAQPTNGSQTSSTGTLSVKTHVINDNTNSTLDASYVFMLLKIGQIQQLFKGSEEGITFTLPANTQYSVTVAELQMTHFISLSGNCGGALVALLGGNTTILPDEIKTCTITLDDRGSNNQILSVGNRTLQNLTSFPTVTPENETVCDDGIDNDNDVKVDAADEDCFVIGSSPTADKNATTTSLLPSTQIEQGATQTQTQTEAQQQAEENNPPTADVGDDFSTESGKTVKLNGEASSDSDAGQTLSYLWEQVSPDSPSVSLNVEREEVAAFKAPNVDEDTKFRFQLTVNDGKGGKDTDSLTVIVLGTADNEEQKEEEEKQEQNEEETKSLKTEELTADSSSDAKKE